MRGAIARTLIVYAIFASIPFTLFAQQSSITEREALASELRNAWLPLESGLAVSGSEGTPISAKYEIDDGAFQLSVYTMKGERFSEVIVDYSVGTILKVDPITDGGDLAAAQNQLARAQNQLAQDCVVFDQ